MIHASDGIGEIVEQDTIDDEDIHDLLEFILPDRDTLRDASQISFSFNKRVFSGWVRQPSACCGAASIAGAFNSLIHSHRKELGALSHVDVVEGYCHIFLEKLCKQTASFERRLGAQLENLFVLVNDILNRNGREIGGKKHYGASKTSVSNALKQLAKRHVEKCHTSDGDSLFDEKFAFSATPRGFMDCIVELFRIDGIDFEAEEKSSGSASEIKDGHDSEESDCDEEIEDNFSGKSQQTEKLKKIKVWDWMKDLMSIIKNISGLKKLMSLKPSTSAIGNWGLLEVTDLLSEYAGLGSCLQARLFMGKKRLGAAAKKLDVGLSRADKPETIAQQWNALRAEFGKSDTVLLFHLTNHYSLIFAMREWVTTAPAVAVKAGNSKSAAASTQPAGVDALTSADNTPANASAVQHEAGIHLKTVTVRQLLCARRGQRPTAWIDFEEARDIMLGWEGYKILAISYCPSSQDLRGPTKEEMVAQLRCRLREVHDSEELGTVRLLFDLPEAPWRRKDASDGAVTCACSIGETGSLGNASKK